MPEYTSEISAPLVQEVLLKASGLSKCFINSGFIPSVKDSIPLSTLQPKPWKKKAGDTHSLWHCSPAKSQRQCRGYSELRVMACVCVRVHKKSLKRSLMSLKPWNGGMLKQQWINLFPHTVNHTHLRWGLEGRPVGASSPTASASLAGPPSVKDQEEGASSRDGKLSNQTTQVVHLGGQLIRSSGKQKTLFIYHQ